MGLRPALWGSVYMSHLWRDCTRRGRMAPRMPTALPPSRASSPTCRSPPSDARFPGDDNHDPWWEKAGRRGFVSHASSNTQLGHVSQRKWRFYARKDVKDVKLNDETLIPFSGFNKKGEEFWLSKNPFIASFIVQIYVINYWLNWEEYIAFYSTLKIREFTACKCF